MNHHLTRFLTTAKQVEAVLINAQTKYTTDPNADIRKVNLIKLKSEPNTTKEISELETELSRKEALIEKYTKKLTEWEKTFAQLKASKNPQ